MEALMERGDLPGNNRLFGPRPDRGAALASCAFLIEWNGFSTAHGATNHQCPPV